MLKYRRIAFEVLETTKQLIQVLFIVLKNTNSFRNTVCQVVFQTLPTTVAHENSKRIEMLTAALCARTL